MAFPLLKVLNMIGALKDSEGQRDGTQFAGQPEETARRGH